MALTIDPFLTTNLGQALVSFDVKGITEKSPLADKIKALKGLKLSGTAVGSFSYQVMLYY